MRDARTRLLEHFEPLRIEFWKKERRARDIGLRPCEASHKASRDSVAADGHHNRNGRGGLPRRARSWRSMGDEEINRRSNKLSYQARKPIVLFVCPAKLNNNVLALNVAELMKARSELVYCLCRACSRRRA